jgi:hypothetical protein
VWVYPLDSQVVKQKIVEKIVLRLKKTFGEEPKKKQVNQDIPASPFSYKY